jgi:hypothetical protein
MLLFSPFLFCITAFTRSSSKTSSNYTYYSPLLLHTPYKLGPITNCILVYEWFYNLYYHCPPSRFSSLSSLHKSSSDRLLHRPHLSLHHLLFFIYIIFNVLLVHSVHVDLLPIASLGVLPTIFFGIWYFSSSSSPPFIAPPASLPSPFSTTQQPSSNYEKLCYLTAWQSALATNTKLM